MAAAIAFSIEVVERLAKIPGIGTSVRPNLADLAKPDRVVAVND